MRLNMFIRSARVFRDLSPASKSHDDSLLGSEYETAHPRNVDVLLGSLSVGVVLKHPPKVYDHRVRT